LAVSAEAQSRSVKVQNFVYLFHNQDAPSDWPEHAVLRKLRCQIEMVAILPLELGDQFREKTRKSGVNLGMGAVAKE
jgi:hypothetical protein